MLTARIKIMPKPGVLDPQGKTVMQALESMGFSNMDDTRIGKYIEIKLNDLSREEASTQVDSMCRKLLANTVIEAYEFDII